MADKIRRARPRRRASTARRRPGADGRGARPLHPALALQRRAGNRAVRALLRADAATGGGANAAEREADASAASLASPRSGARGAAAGPRAGGPPRRARDGAVEPVTSVGDRPTGSGIRRALGDTTAGRPLPAGARRFMEARFGADFRAVRVHAGPRAHGLSRALDARAFTVGRDIYFGRGEYRPASARGRRLLAHELTHTLQQARTGPALQRKPIPAAIGGVTMTKKSTVKDAKLKDVVTDVLGKVVSTSMGGTQLDELYVSSVNDGDHSKHSRHFTNLAVDISRVKTEGAASWQFMQTSYPSNADVKAVVEALQDGFEKEVGTPGVRENFGPHIKKKNGKPHKVGGHSDHIHMSCNA